MDEISKELYDTVKSNLNHYDFKATVDLLSSESSPKRLEGLFAVRLNKHFQDKLIFDLTIDIIEDKDNDCRWQSLIVCSEFMEVATDEIWEIILEYGNSNDEDMRSVVATILLEHFFENNFELKRQYLNDLEQKILKDRYVNLRKTLSMCWSSRLAAKFPELVKYKAY